MPTHTNLLQKALKGVRRRTFLISKDLLQRATRAKNRRGGKQVTFVAGVQRSGTNMMMNVLERSLDTDVYHERDPRAFEHYEMRAPEVIRGLVDRSPAPRVVVKSLCELQNLGNLLDTFAPAKAVWVIRDFEDVVNSQLRLWPGRPEIIRRIVEDGDTAGWRGQGMSAETLAMLREHYHPGLSIPSACALFSYFRNILYFEQQLDRDPRVRLVRYEQLVTNPHETFQTVFDFLGLRYTPRVSSQVFASSVRKATPPEIDPAIRTLCQGLDLRFDRALNAATTVSPDAEPGRSHSAG